jgi:imidazolonepropionase-like amidohydrolase
VNIVFEKLALKVLLFAVIGFHPLSQSAEADILALVGGQLIDGTGSSPVVDSVILVSGSIITAIGTVEDLDIPQDAQVIDTNGMSVLPGLIDLHMHFDILGHIDIGVWLPAHKDEMRTRIMPLAAKAKLYAGVTTVREVGGNPENSLWFRDLVNSGEILGPRIVSAGPMLRRGYNVYGDGSYVDSWGVESPSEAHEAVQSVHEMGFDLIKAQDPGFSQEEFTAIYSEAHRLGKRVASHLYDAEDIRRALQSGLGKFDTIEHFGVGDAVSYDKDILRMILDQEVAVVPTIVFFDSSMEMGINREGTDVAEWRDLPDDLYQEIRSSIRQADINSTALLGRETDEMRLGRYAKIRQAYEAGVTIGVGTDSGTSTNPHHSAIWREMALLQDKVGMSPSDVIQAATKTNAEIIGLIDEIGTIEVGKLADIIVVDGNPLRDVAELRTIKHVLKGGVLVR